jgi:alanine racemase
MIEATGVNHFSVFNVEEAREALKVKQDHCDLMVMGFVDDDQIEWCIENDISFYVFTEDRMEAVCREVKNTSKPARIHVEMETGMNRTGFLESQLDYVIEKLKDHKDEIILEGLCTHFAGAEEIENFERVRNQLETFHRLCSKFKDHGLKPNYRHTACSASVLNFPESALDLVRVGISNYGFWPNNETRMLHLNPRNGEKKKNPLKRVLSWKSKIMSIKPVDEDEYVSYGTSFITNRDSKMATVPVGYGHGFSRDLSNLGHVLTNGKRVPVVGAVNMSMMVVDVTDLPDVKIGDEVVLIGKQGDKEITVDSFSDMNNSMNYELLTRLPIKIPREKVD